METPKEYAQRELEENNGLSGNARIYIVNMLYASYLESDKSFYKQALKELDNL